MREAMVIQGEKKLLWADLNHATLKILFIGQTKIVELAKLAFMASQWGLLLAFFD